LKPDYMLVLGAKLSRLREGWRPTLRIFHVLEAVASAYLEVHITAAESTTIPIQAAADGDLLQVKEKNAAYWEEAQTADLSNGFTLPPTIFTSQVEYKTATDDTHGEGGADDLSTCKCLLAQEALGEKVFEVAGLLSQEEAAHFVQCFEALQFDQTHHPMYQSHAIDRAEFEFMKNERAVYQASESEVGGLFARLRPHLPQQFKSADANGSTCGCTWKLWGLNDMWRCYRYREAGHEFPIHNGEMMHIPCAHTLYSYTALMYRRIKTTPL
jgi:hypothetical protein